MCNCCRWCHPLPKVWCGAFWWWSLWYPYQSGSFSCFNVGSGFSLPAMQYYLISIRWMSRWKLLRSLRPVSSRSTKQPGWRSPPIVTVVTICLTRCSFRLFPNIRWDALWGIYSDVTLPYQITRDTKEYLRIWYINSLHSQSRGRIQLGIHDVT